MERKSGTWYYAPLVAVITHLTISVDGIEDDLKRCCNLGKSWAEKKRDECENFPVPVPNIPFETQVGSKLHIAEKLASKKMVAEKLCVIRVNRRML